jgi:hypothetical protein
MESLQADGVQQLNMGSCSAQVPCHHLQSVLRQRSEDDLATHAVTSTAFRDDPYGREVVTVWNRSDSAIDSNVRGEATV